MDKRRINKSIKQLQRIKTWQLVILLIIVGFLAATFLRLNNIGMIERRKAVVAADESGDQAVIQSRLYDLQRYVTSHMNTDMGNGLYLTESRKRDVEDAYTKASKSNIGNTNVYRKVQDICEPKFTHYSYAYLQCTADELQKFPQGQNLVSSITLPPTSNYLHVFVSPIWSPDFAGWSVVLFVVIFIMIVIRATTVIVLKSIIRHRYKSI